MPSSKLVNGYACAAGPWMGWKAFWFDGMVIDVLSSRSNISSDLSQSTLRDLTSSRRKKEDSYGFYYQEGIEVGFTGLPGSVSRPGSRPNRDGQLEEHRWHRRQTGCTRYPRQ